MVCGGGSSLRSSRGDKESTHQQEGLSLSASFTRREVAAIMDRQGSQPAATGPSCLDK